MVVSSPFLSPGLYVEIVSGDGGNRIPDACAFNAALYRLSYISMAGNPGLEPGTIDLTSRRSNQLS